MSRTSLARTLALTLVLAASLPDGVALARKQDEFHYPFDRVWNTAVRMVRVDMRLPVTDRDPEAGYLLFEYVDHGKRFPGSLELVKGERDQRPLVTAVVQVQGMPSYVEQMLLDKLKRKLKEELGEPMEPPNTAPEQPKAPEDKPSGDQGQGDKPKEPSQGEQRDPSDTQQDREDEAWRERG